MAGSCVCRVFLRVVYAVFIMFAVCIVFVNNRAIPERGRRDELIVNCKCGRENNAV